MSGGDIINLKSQITNSKKGYSLLELVVVMGIMGFLTVIGAGGLYTARVMKSVDATTDELLATIRKAQTNAMAIVEGGSCPGSQTTKLWGVNISNSENDFKLAYYCGTSGGTLTLVESNALSPYKVTINSNDKVFFSTPFAKGYNFVGSAPTFSESSNPEKDWVPSSSGTARQEIIISSPMGYERKLVIEANGDAYEE